MLLVGVATGPNPEGDHTGERRRGLIGPSDVGDPKIAVARPRARRQTPRVAEAEKEMPLGGGFINTVTRVGDTVRRRVTKNRPFARELLGFLERAGWDGAPRPADRLAGLTVTGLVTPTIRAPTAFSSIRGASAIRQPTGAPMATSRPTAGS
jgi:hypothetical protein